MVLEDRQLLLRSSQREINDPDVVSGSVGLWERYREEIARNPLVATDKLRISKILKRSRDSAVDSGYADAAPGAAGELPGYGGFDRAGKPGRGCIHDGDRYVLHDLEVAPASEARAGCWL